MATVYDRDFSVALVDATGFDSVSNADGDMTWNSGTSPLDGSAGYVDVVVDDTTANFGLISFTALSTQTKFRHNHRMAFSTLAIGSDNDSVRLFNWQNNDGTVRGCTITLIRLSGALNIRLTSINDDNTTLVNADTVLSGTPEWFEVEVTKATTVSSNDGVYKLWIGGGDYPAGGTQIAEITGRDYFTNFAALAYIRLGATNINASLSGAFSLDRARANDTGAAILVVPNTAPTVSDPGTIYSGLGYEEPIGTLVTVADTDSNLSTIRYQCTEANADIKVTLSGGVTVSAGTNNTHDFTISGSHAALLTVHATAKYVSTAVGTDAAVIITATDDLAANASRTFTIITSYGFVEADNQTDLNATLATLPAVNAVAEVSTVTFTGIDSGGLEGTAQTVVTTSETVTNEMAFGAGVSHSKLSHTVGLHL